MDGQPAFADLRRRDQVHGFADAEQTVDDWRLQHWETIKQLTQAASPAPSPWYNSDVGTIRIVGRLRIGPVQSSHQCGAPSDSFRLG